MAKRSLVNRIARRIGGEMAGLRLFGLGSLTHHWHRLTGRSASSVGLAGAGRVEVRPAEPDLASFKRVFGDREYQVPVTSVRSAVRERHDALLAGGTPPVIVDAGAYVGASSLWFHREFPGAHIVALEPDAQSFELLRRNLGPIGGATAVHAAVGGTEGKARIVAAADSWATQVERASTGVRVTTMNSAFAMVPGGRPFLAKINIEGFEKDVFSANLEWLDEIAVLFIEPHDWLLPGQHSSRPFQKALGERDFHLFITGPHLCYVRL